MAETPFRVVIQYEITGIIEKAYLKSASADFAADGFPKTGPFPYKHPYLIIVNLEETQRNITSFLLENSVSYTRIAEELLITRGTNPQTVNNSHSACLTKHQCYRSALFCGNKNRQQNMNNLGKDLLLF